MTNLYKRGLAPLMVTGVIKPTYNRVVLRAVMRGAGSVLFTEEDKKKAVCHEIMAVGPEADGHFGVGEHCVHISTAGDSPEEDDNSEWAIVRAEDIILAWDPSDLEAACRADAVLRELLGLTGP